MKLVNDHIQNQAPHFMDQGILDISTLNKSGVIGATATSIQRITDVFHWITEDHFFGEATAVGMRSEKSVKSGILAPKHFDELTTFGIDSC